MPGPLPGEHFSHRRCLHILQVLAAVAADAAKEFKSKREETSTTEAALLSESGQAELCEASPGKKPHWLPTNRVESRYRRAGQPPVIRQADTLQRLAEEWRWGYLRFDFE